MTVKERLMDDLKSAMREKDNVRKDAVQMVRAAVLQVEKDKKITLEDDGVIDIISKEVKRYRDVLPDYEKSGRDDLIAEIKRKIDVLIPYLPTQLSQDELKTIVSDVIAETGACSMKDMGKVMSVIMPKVKGKCDGRVVNAMIKDCLS